MQNIHSARAMGGEVAGLELGGDTQIGLGLILVALIALIIYQRLTRKPSAPWKGHYRADRDAHTFVPAEAPAATAIPLSRGIGKQLHAILPEMPVPRITSPDVGDQLHAVMQGTFQKRRLMNPAEYRVFKIIEDDLLMEKSGHRVFAQTSLGEVLQSTDQAAFHSINAKRVDLLIIDRTGWPALAVEYQGGQHYQGTAAARDAIKKEALRRAGVGYVEIVPGDSDDQIRFRVREQLGWKADISIEARVAAPSRPRLGPAASPLPS